MYQREADVDMWNAVKSLLADVSSVSPSSEQSNSIFLFIWYIDKQMNVCSCSINHESESLPAFLFFSADVLPRLKCTEDLASSTNHTHPGKCNGCELGGPDAAVGHQSIPSHSCQSECAHCCGSWLCVPSAEEFSRSQMRDKGTSWIVVEFDCPIEP